jgi:hypothetical protein
VIKSRNVGSMKNASPERRSEIAHKIWVARHAKLALIPVDQRPEFSPRDFTCSSCGVVFHGVRPNQESHYCSKKCSGAAISKKLAIYWRTRVVPGKPINRTGLHKSTCKTCSVTFWNPKNRVWYCKDHQADKWKARADSVRPKITWLGWCRGCGKGFPLPDNGRSFKKPRKYCSYPCFVRSGGTIRAGTEASRMTRIYGVKKDANHCHIVDVLKRAGVSYIDLSALGCGVPDLLVHINGMELWEIKNRKTSYGRRGYNKIQLAWLQAWRGPTPRIVESPDQALSIINESRRAA